MILLFILSILGVIIPLIPDTLFLWISFIVYELFTGERNLSVSFWMIMLFFTMLIISSDYFSNIYFIKKYGGSNKAVIGAIFGLIIGIIILGPLGIIIVPFLIVYIISFMERKKNKLKVSFATLLAIIAGTFFKIILQIIMIIWFLILVI